MMYSSITVQKLPPHLRRCGQMASCTWALKLPSPGSSSKKCGSSVTAPAEMICDQPSLVSLQDSGSRIRDPPQVGHWHDLLGFLIPRLISLMLCRVYVRRVQVLGRDKRNRPLNEGKTIGKILNSSYVGTRNCSLTLTGYMAVF